MFLKAILYPLAVIALVAGPLLAWINGAGVLILVMLVVLIAAAVVRDWLAGRRAEAATKLLPAEEREEGLDTEAHGLHMERVEEETRKRRNWRYPFWD